MDPDYNGLITPPYPDAQRRARVAGDKRGLVYGAGTLQPFICDLESAQSLREYDFSGDVLYVDKLSTGTIKFRFDTSWQRSFPLGANAAVRGVPFKSVLLEWDVQAGKTAVIWYGYGVEIVPPNQDITSIGSITNPVDIRGVGFTYGSKFSSNTVILANANEAVFVPATNTNGARIKAARFLNEAPGGWISAESLVAHTGVPATYTDGDILVGNMNAVSLAAGVYESHGYLLEPVQIDSGKGLWFRNSTGTSEATGNRNVLYDIL